MTTAYRIFITLLLLACAGAVIETVKTLGKDIMSKLSDLATTLAAIDAEVVNVAASFAALKQELANVDLPTDAQAALDKLSTDAANLAAAANQPTPTPAPSPAPASSPPETNPT